MQLDQFLDQRETDAAALVGAATCTVDPAETLEQMRQFGSRYPRSSIANRDFRVIAVSRSPDRDIDFTLERELERV